MTSAVCHQGERLTGTIVLGSAALVVKAMGVDHLVPPLGSNETTELRALPGVAAQIPAPVVVPAVVPVAVPPARPVEAISVVGAEPEAEPPPLAATADAADVGKVSVVPAAYEPKHAAPDLGLNLLGMKLAVDLS